MKLSDLGVTRHKFELSNGIPVVIYERIGLPVYMRAVFDAGSRFDNPGKEGQAHFVEHMIAAGTKQFPTKTQMATRLENLGGIFGASTGKEAISINVGLGNVVDFSVGAEMLGGMLQHSLYQAEVFENERESILAEQGDRDANLKAATYHLGSKLFFQDTDLARRECSGSIRACTLEELLSFHHDYLSAERCAVVVSGQLKPVQVRSVLEAQLGSLPRGTRLRSSRVTQGGGRRMNVENRANKQIELTYGFVTPPRGHEDNPALEIIAEIIGGGRASSLSRILRHERGLIYSVGVSRLSMVGGGSWTVSTSAAVEKLQQVVNGIAEEFQRVYDGGLTAGELEFAQNKIIKSGPIQMQTVVAWATYHSHDELYGRDGKTFADHLDAIGKVTIADLARVGQKYFAPGTSYFAAVGDVTEDQIAINH